MNLKKNKLKIFFLSFPFDEPNSGDFDYCNIMTRLLNEIAPNSAEFINNLVVKFSTAKLKLLTTQLNEFKNDGGELFYNNLEKYFEDSSRKELANLILSYIQNQKNKFNILNIQLRPPEAGLIFSALELKDLQNRFGFLISITVHEYKLNFQRRWLQTICHDYFQVADLLYFFNSKDLKTFNSESLY